MPQIPPKDPAVMAQQAQNLAAMLDGNVRAALADVAAVPSAKSRDYARLAALRIARQRVQTLVELALVELTASGADEQAGRAMLAVQVSVMESLSNCMGYRIQAMEAELRQ